MAGETRRGKLHYIVIGDSGRGSADPGISAWVEANGTAVSGYSGLYRLDASDVG
ncbi:hypothetical protein [Streptomyces sp. NPDC001500]